MNNKPCEMRKSTSAAQTSFLPGLSSSLPAPKLRIEWAISNTREFFIPAYKSVDETSLISLAWRSSAITQGQEILSLDGRQAATFYSENLPFDLDGNRKVISLIGKIVVDERAHQTNFSESSGVAKSL